MSGPGGGGGFADQLEWLLVSIPRQPGSHERFELEDLVSALAGEGPRGTRWAARAGARAWLMAMRAGQATGSTPLATHYLAILEDLFRLPAGYFHDEPTRRATDERIAFAWEAAEKGVTVIGPCRVRTSLLGLEALHSLHQQASDELDRRAGA